jgi:lipopolysaccharide/colanic/teichoic acid biosynthesis glycosyltransferase
LTRVGRLIRRMSLDELPQLMNVLKGEMSLVGPRPEMPFIVDGYGDLERKRLAVRPGITGLWQISPARAFPIHENIQFDLHYIRHQNLVLDCAILVRTIAAVIDGVGAI